MPKHFFDQTGKIRITEIILLLIIAALSVALWWQSSKHERPAAPGERKVLFYRNPMNPAITSSIPAKDEMGMDYIPVYADEGTVPQKTPEQEAEDFFADDDSGLAGLATVTLSPHGIQVAGIVTEEAIREPFQQVIRTVGLALADETRTHRVQTKIQGWVEKLFVNFLGQPVQKGEPLLSLYSPELLSSQEEFLRALEAAGFKAGAADRSLDQTLIRSARRRLELFDVPESFIEQLQTSRTIQREVTLLAPASGFVTGKDVLAGQSVAPGMLLFTISDLSMIWVEADFFEYEAGYISIGQEAVLTSPFDDRLEVTSHITYIYPFINPDSRTLKVRFELANADLLLKPNMYVDVSLRLDLGESVVIPDTAIIDSGVRKVVFVETEAAVFEPREVRVGARSRGKAQILSGVAAGEWVAVKGNFLLDSESRLQAIIQSKMLNQD